MGRKLMKVKSGDKDENVEALNWSLFRLVAREEIITIPRINCSPRIQLIKT